jgi:hypothetical protein
MNHNLDFVEILDANSAAQRVRGGSALVTTDHALPLHAYIEISFEPLETGHGALRVMARVTCNLKGGVGVEGCEFAPSAVTDLLRSPSF